MPIEPRPPLYISKWDILRWHGLFAYAGYKTVSLTKNLTLRGWLEHLMRIPRLRERTVDQSSDKLWPWCQDIILLITFLITIGFIIAAVQFQIPSALVKGTAIWLLIDKLCYLAGVLWFDDLRPGRSAIQAAVFSHRRVFFQAVLHLLETILLFAVLARSFGPQAVDFGRSCQDSFEIATFLASPRNDDDCYPTWLANSQVAISILLFVIILGTVTSAAYARAELAPRVEIEETNHDQG